MEVRTRSAPTTGVSWVSAENRAPFLIGAKREVLSAYIRRMNSVTAASSLDENEVRRTRLGRACGADTRPPGVRRVRADCWSSATGYAARTPGRIPRRGGADVRGRYGWSASSTTTGAWSLAPL